MRSKKKIIPDHKPELLAPAGSIETFFTAFEQGADAVYLGTEQFNARVRAQNFAFDDIARLVAYAHSIGKKVYITLNTVVKEQELPALIDTLDALRRIGPDAFIIQELGVAKLAWELAPEIPRHASTQMTIHNLDGAIQAQKLGFSRIVTAREMTLDELAAVRKQCDVELETFIHGAMCYCIAGQCYFSSYDHGKSGNRGACLQPCRRVYDTGTGKGPIFAPLDLNASPVLEQLIAMGIRSFKIEGRLKPAETIGQTVAAYRKLIDAYPHITPKVVQEARRCFNLAIGRKQSTGFFRSPSPEYSMVGNGMSQSGRFMGKVHHSHGTLFEIRAYESIKVGDRLTIQKTQHQQPQAFNVKAIFKEGQPIRRSRTKELISIEAPFEVQKDAAVVKIIDADAITREAKLHDEKKWPKAQTRAKLAYHTRLTMTYEGAVRLETEIAGQPVSVETWPSYEATLDTDVVLESLSEPGPYYPVHIQVQDTEDFPDGVPMDETEVLALRDELLAVLTDKLDTAKAAALAALEEPLPALPESPHPLSPNLVRVRVLDEAQSFLNEGHHIVSLPLGMLTGAFLERCQKAEWIDRLMVELPAFCFAFGKEHDDLQHQIKLTINAGVRRYMVSNLGHFNLLSKYMKYNLTIIADDPFHCLNSACAQALHTLGATQVMAAIEADETILRGMAKRVPNLVVYTYGKVPLFRSRQPHPEGVKEARSKLASGEPVEIFHRDGLTCTVPKRDFSLCPEKEALREMGVAHFLYDLTYAPASPKKLKELLKRKQFDPEKDTMMNYKRGLE